jgi:hypothetical protein
MAAGFENTSSRKEPALNAFAAHRPLSAWGSEISPMIKLRCFEQSRGKSSEIKLQIA